MTWCRLHIWRHTAAPSVQESHLVPFSPSGVYPLRTPNLAAKLQNNFHAMRKDQINYYHCIILYVTSIGKTILIICGLSAVIPDKKDLDLFSFDDK